MRISLLIVSALVAAVVLTAAAPGASDSSTVRVALAEGSLVPSTESVPAGKVTFDVVNDGKVEHELIVVRTSLAPDALPMGLEGPAVRLAGPVVLGTPHTHGAHSKRVNYRHVAPGRSRRETIVLEPGNYVLLCSLPGHYESGQRARLVVRAP